MKKQHRLKEDQRVKLKSNGEDSPYTYAAAGSEGWIRSLDFDGVGFPIVYIEWDKDHWAFNGEPNQWTLEDHFEPVEEEMSKHIDPDEMAEEFAAFLKWKEEHFSSKSEDPEASERAENYIRTLDRAVKHAAKAGAFMLIMIEPTIAEDGIPTFNPIVYNSYKDEAAGILLESELAQLAAESYQHVAMLHVAQILKERENESGR